MDKLQPDALGTSNVLRGHKLVRMTLLAAVAAISLGDKPARAETLKKPAQASSWLFKAPAVKGKHDDKAHSQPELRGKPVLVDKAARQQHALWKEKAEQAAAFQHMISRMKNVHLEARDRPQKLWQYEEFCEEMVLICQAMHTRPSGVEYETTLTPEMFAEIDGVNKMVNEMIIPKTDMEQYGVQEKWVLPTQFGDCEDYVLLKILRLVERGFDPATLHIIIVFDENGDGHAILGVDVYRPGSRVPTTLILDNKNNEVRTIDEMEQRGYKARLSSFLTVDNRGKFHAHFYRYSAVRPR